MAFTSTNVLFNGGDRFCRHHLTLTKRRVFGDGADPRRLAATCFSSAFDELPVQSKRQTASRKSAFWRLKDIAPHDTNKQAKAVVHDTGPDPPWRE